MKKLNLSFLSVLLLAISSLGRVHAQADQALLGATAPAFNLKNIDGNMVGLENYANSAKGVIIVFTCNHCPYSVMYEDRIIALDNQYRPQGFPVVAINPNDPIAYKSDNFKNMQKRAKKKGFKFPYLVDESQEIAKAYGATRTPHVYVAMNEGKTFKVRYVGAIDDNTETGSVKVKYVEDAIAKLSAGSQPETAYTKAVGCGIKWKAAN